jgi:beta-glucosidase
MTKYIIPAIIILMALTSPDAYSQSAGIDQKVDSLLNKMTLEEKIGQLNQLNGDWAATGPVTTDLGNKLDQIREGKIGSILNIMGVEHTRTFQEAAILKSPHGLLPQRLRPAESTGPSPQWWISPVIRVGDGLWKAPVDRIDITRKSIVLLKNSDHLLPLSWNLKSIALIGPLVKAEKELKGYWSFDMSDENDIISLYEGMEQQADKINLQYARGCSIDDSSETGFAEAVQTALTCNIVIMAMGERADMTGEAKSKSNIHLPGVQEKLIQAIVATGKPVVVILMAGRPMVFNWTADHVPAIIYSWWLGDQAGNAIADVLFGRYNPSGKLPITFPRTEGQIPIYYNYLNTGRPASTETDLNYRSAYIDLPNSPQYAFGHGLSYTTFLYSNLKISKKEINSEESFTISFDLKNTGHYAGEEVVQLYLGDLVAQPVRPVKELKDFQKVMLEPGETKTLTFIIDREKLSYYNDKFQWIVQPGEFKLMIGSASDDIRLDGMINYE